MTVFRVLRTAKATLSRSFHLDEVVTPTTGAPAVTVSRLDGTVLHGPTNAAGPAADGSYSYTFPGSDVLDELNVTWSIDIGGDLMTLDQDVIEVVGGFYFGLAEGRAIDPALASTTKFTTDDLIRRRVQTEDECERITGQAWVPRFARETLSARGARESLVLGHPLIRAVRSVSVGGQAFTVPQLAGLQATAEGVLILTRGWAVGSRHIVVEYEHGHDRPPSEIVEASLIRFKSKLLEGRSALPDRAERVVTTTDSGTTVFGSPTVEKTGIPAVDAAYARYPSPRPGFG